MAFDLRASMKLNDRFSSVVRKAEQRVKRMNTEVNRLNRSFTQVNGSVRRLNESINRTTRNIRQTNAQARILNSAFRDIGRSSRQTASNVRGIRIANNVATRLQQAERYFERMTQESGRLRTRLDQVLRVLRNIESSARRIQQLFQRMTVLSNQLTGSLRRNAQQTDRVRDSLNQADQSANRLRNTIARIRPLNLNLSSANQGVLGLNGSFMTLLGTVGGVYGAAKGLEATLGSAMKQEMESIAMKALFKENTKAANEFFNFLKDKSVESTASIDDLIMGGRGFASMTKDVGTLKDMVNLAERLAMVNPAEGFQGAQFSMRELLSGDVASIKERFNIDGPTAHAIKDVPTLEGKLKALDKVLADMGYTQQFVNTVNDTAYAKWQKLGDTVRQTFTDIGLGALEQAKPAIDSLTKTLESKEFAGFKQEVTGAFATLIQNASNLAVKMYQNREAIAQFGSNALKVLADVGRWVKNIAVFFVNNWSVIKPILVGVVAAFAGFKIVTTVMALVRGLTAVIGIARTAFTLLRLSIIMFPGAWIIAAIGGVVAAGIWMYRNWDTVKEKTKALWDKLAEMPGIGDKVIKPINSIIEYGKSLASQWDSTKGTWSNVWDIMKTAASDAVEGIIKKIDGLIGKINTIPGVYIKPIGGSSAPKGNKNHKPQKVKPPKMFRTPSRIPTRIADPGAPKLPGHSTGLEKVPFDGYKAELHKNESVLTAQQSDMLRKMGVLRSNGKRPVLDTSAFDSKKASASTSKGTGTAAPTKQHITINGGIHIHGAQKTTKQMARELVQNIQHVIAAGGA
ncbi:hypothetical protein [Pseudobacillus badius]|uniref:hypothetical protein n=1 Tax=Bacillus badius TaxID=1455 RepID=UPI0025554A95|nr:hypothetical protein [Bacillus badius]